MAATRDRTEVIAHDFLSLIEVEIVIYGRNREHLIRLPEASRDDVRKFMNDCSVTRAKIVHKLEQYYKLGSTPEASAPLADAQKAADKMLQIVDRGTAILAALAKL